MQRLHWLTVGSLLAALLAPAVTVQAEEVEWPWHETGIDAEINDKDVSTPDVTWWLTEVGRDGLNDFARTRAMIKFVDIADFVAANIPAGEPIYKVTMQLRSPVNWSPPGHEFQFEVYRILKPWLEDEDIGPTWNNQYDEEEDGQGGIITPAVPWSEPGLGAGTDRAADPTDIFHYSRYHANEVYFGWLQLDVTDDVLAMLDGTYENHGWLIQDTLSEETPNPDSDNGSTKLRWHNTDDTFFWDRVPRLQFRYGTDPDLDLNGDGVIDSYDIDVLSINPQDRNGDGQINQQDREYFVEVEMGKCMGDTDLSGLVDEADLAWVADGWKLPYRDKGEFAWGVGDFTGDGFIDEADLAYLADSWKQPCGPASSVPEPGTLAFIGAGVALLVRRR